MLGLTVLLAVSASFAAPPEAYADLYGQLSARLTQTSAKIDAQWNKTPAAVDFSAEMLTANSNRGVQLLRPETLAAAKLEMGRLRELGVKAVTLSINFPVLYEPFHRPNGTDYQAFLTFYKRVVDEARSQKLKVIVELGSGIFPGVYSRGAEFNVQPFYATIHGIEQYRDMRTAMAIVAATELRPDYLSLSEEPDTEVALTKLKVNDVGTYTDILTHQVKKLREANVAGMKIGAGVGTWQRDAEEWAKSYAQHTGVDYIGLHVYPINSLTQPERFDLLWRLFTLADLAQQHGKPTAVGECWLHKVRDNELKLMNGVSDPTAFERDVYSFWEPLDAQFLAVMVKGAHWKKFLYLSPFWTRMLYGGYVDYDEAQRALSGGKEGQGKLFALCNRRAAEGLRTGRFSPAGDAYGRLIGGEASGK